MSLAAFFHPAFLWFSALAAVPLIIHLLNRRRYRTVYWAAMDFLLQAYKKKHRRMRLENLLLLLLRCAIPIVLAFALARPFFGAGHPLSLIAEDRRDVVLVVDDSYSMNRRVGTGTLFQSARSQVERVVSSLQFDQGDKFTIMTLSKEPQILVQSSSSTTDLRRAMLRLAAPRYQEADLASTVEMLMEEVLPEIPAEAEIYVFSDFQRRTFEPPLVAEEGDGERVTVKTLLRRMTDENATLRLINLSDGTPQPENAGVTDLRAAESLVIAHQSVRLTAQVQRRGGAGRGSGYFRVDDRPDRPRALQYDADGRATVEVYESFSQPGDHFVEFHLEEDELEDDNARYLRVQVVESIPVLVVDGDPVGIDPLAGEVGTLVEMLDPHFGEVGGDNIQRLFEVNWMPHHEFNRGVDLDDYHAVILGNVREVAEDRTQDLLDYVNRGGGVWFFVGDQVRPDSYNRRMYRENGEGLLPLPLAAMPVGEVPLLGTSVSSPDDWFRMQIVEELHPVVRESVSESRRRILRTAAVFRYLAFESEEGAPQSLRVPLRFEDSLAPALLDHTVGSGHAIWFVSTADDDWTFLPASPGAFFPLAYDVMSYLVSRDPTQHHLPIGAAIRRSVPAAPEPYTITRPDGETRFIQDLPQDPLHGHFPLLPFTETNLPGIYQLDLRMGAAEEPITEYFAVNVDAAEGDLASLDREELGSLLERVPFEYGSEVATGGDAGPRQQGEIWKALMATLIAMLVAETLLAWRFGAYTS